MLKNILPLIHLTSYLPLECKVYSKMLVYCEKEIAIWFVLRAINHTLYGKDFNGGSVTFNVTLLAEALDYTRDYTLRLLKSGKEKGYFQSITDTANRDIKKIKLTGICKIVPRQSKEKEYQRLGTCAYATVAELRNPTTLAIHIDTQCIQAYSRFIATEEYRKSHTGNNNGLKTPAEIFDLFHLDQSVLTSDSVIGLYGVNHQFQTAFVSGKWVSYGVAQATVAERLGVSTVTVCNHLKTAEHVRIAKADMTSCVEREIEYEETTGLKHFIKVNSLSICDNIRALGKVFKFLPCVYNLNYVLAKPRCLERKIKRAVDKFNLSKQTLQTTT